MTSMTKNKNVSLNLTEEAHARLLAAVESVRARTGLPTVSKANVAAMAMDRGLQRIIEENQNAAGGS